MWIIHLPLGYMHTFNVSYRVHRRNGCFNYWEKNGRYIIGADHFFPQKRERATLWEIDCDFSGSYRGTGLGDPRYSFCFCPRLYVGCICPFFSDSAIFPVAFFHPEKSGYFFFGWIDTWKFPPTSRRGIINYRVAARTDVSDSASLSLSVFLLFFFSVFWPRILGVARIYIRQSSHSARSIARHERNAIVCMVPPGERRRVA